MQNAIVPDNISLDINGILNHKYGIYIQTVKENYYNKHKSSRQLIYGEDMIFNVNILMFCSRPMKQTISKPSYQSNQ